MDTLKHKWKSVKMQNQIWIYTKISSRKASSHMFSMVWSYGFSLERHTKQTLSCKFSMFTYLPITIVQFTMELLCQKLNGVVQ